MAVTIGGITFVTARAGVDAPATEMEWVYRGNVDGIVLRELGERGRPFEVVCFADAATAGAAQTLREAIHALRGETLTLNLGNGESYPNTTVLDTKVAAAEPRALVSGGVNVAEGASGYGLWCRLECIRN